MPDYEDNEFETESYRRLQRMKRKAEERNVSDHGDMQERRSDLKRREREQKLQLKKRYEKLQQLARSLEVKELLLQSGIKHLMLDTVGDKSIPSFSVFLIIHLQPESAELVGVWLYAERRAKTEQIHLVLGRKISDSSDPIEWSSPPAPRETYWSCQYQSENHSQIRARIREQLATLS